MKYNKPYLYCHKSTYIYLSKITLRETCSSNDYFGLFGFRRMKKIYKGEKEKERGGGGRER